MSTDGNERHSFAPRTPVNDNPDKVTYRRGFITRHQVSGWRFVMRRIASGLAMHDTRMLVDPLRSQSRAVLMGVLLVITAMLGCFVFSFLRPNQMPGNDPILAERDTSALYVRLGERLHPVLNVTSARLAAGRAINPTVVSSEALDKFARGPLIGIPGAPERMVQSASQDARWTLCEDGQGLVLIAGTLDQGGSRARLMPASGGLLVRVGEQDWLLWEGRRSSIDVTDRAVTDAVGIGATAVPRAIAPELLNAIPEGPPLRIPHIVDAGLTPSYSLPTGALVGSVVIAYAAGGDPMHYVVLSDGLQPVSAVLAAALRNSNSYGLVAPPKLDADQIARIPVSTQIDGSVFPAQRIKLVDSKRSPVTCAAWSKILGAQSNSLELLIGSTLPIADGAQVVELVGSGAGGTAQRAVMPPGSGYFVQSIGQQASSPFWISDTGVRYGIGGTRKETEKSIAALGLNEPSLPIPWSFLSVLTPGPTLSQADALIAFTMPKKSQ